MWPTLLVLVMSAQAADAGGVQPEIGPRDDAGELVDAGMEPHDAGLPGSFDAGRETTVIGRRMVDVRRVAGSAQVIGKEELDRQEANDFHRVLQGVPGVYVREEDGFGLRPNIGLRGASADRSSKVTLMEDGVLSGPAPQPPRRLRVSSADLRELLKPGLTPEIGSLGLDSRPRGDDVSADPVALRAPRLVDPRGHLSRDSRGLDLVDV